MSFSESRTLTVPEEAVIQGTLSSAPSQLHPQQPAAAVPASPLTPLPLSSASLRSSSALALEALSGLRRDCLFL